MSAVGLGCTFSGAVASNARHCQIAMHFDVTSPSLPCVHLYTAPQLKEAAPICGAAWYPLLWRATTSRATVAAPDTCRCHPKPHNARQSRHARQSRRRTIGALARWHKW